MGHYARGRKNYLRERPFDRAFLAPPLRPRDLEVPRARELAPRRAEDFRPAAFRAPPFRAPAFRPLVLAFFRPPERALLVFRALEDFLPGFFLPKDLDELFAAFLALAVEVPPTGRALAVGPPALVPPGVTRPAEVELEPNGVRPALPEVPPTPSPPLDVPEDGPLPKLEPPLVPPVPPSPPPVSVDSCRFPEPFGRPLLPLGAPPPKRSSSSSSSSASSPSLTTVASESTSSSSSVSSALSHRRSL